MPYKRRLVRREDTFALSTMTICDILNLDVGIVGEHGSVLQTPDDVRECWEINRHLLNAPESNDNPFGYRPGERHLCWWTLEAFPVHGPRLRTFPDTSLPPTCDHPPPSRGTDGYETTDQYIARNNL